MNLWQIRDYHSSFDKKSTIVKICDAIDDKENGLGLLWISADFEKWFAELDKYKSNYVIGQHRDYLKVYVQHLTPVVADGGEAVQNESGVSNPHRT